MLSISRFLSRIVLPALFSLTAHSATSQVLILDPDEFGTLPQLNKQALVSNYAPDMTGLEPAEKFRGGPIGKVANATGFLTFCSPTKRARFVPQP